MRHDLKDATVERLTGNFKARIVALNNDTRTPVGHTDGWLHAGGVQQAALLQFTFKSRDGYKFRYQISGTGAAAGKTLDISTNSYLGLYGASASDWVLDITSDRGDLQCTWRNAKGKGVRVLWNEALVANGFALSVTEGGGQLYTLEFVG